MNGPLDLIWLQTVLVRLFLAEQAPTPTAEAATATAPKATPVQPPTEKVEEKKEASAMEVEEARPCLSVLMCFEWSHWVTDCLLQLFLAEQAPTPEAATATAPKATPVQPPTEKVEEKKEASAMEVEEARPCLSVLMCFEWSHWVTDCLLQLFLAEQAPTPEAATATAPKATPAQPPAEKEA